MQVMAISCIESPPQTEISLIQSQWYQRLITDYKNDFDNIRSIDDIDTVLHSKKTGIITAIENAAALCGNDEPLDKAYDRLETIIKFLGKPLYISLTHHGETRFGGGNQTEIGIKDDGKSLLDYMNGKKIAVDFSHTSDKLAHDIIDYIDGQNLNIPIIASHSNFREIFDHRRNLPDNLAREIIARGGLIGINLLRAFLHPTNPNILIDHIMHGLELGGENALCFGADYFYTKSHPDKSRIPFYFAEHEHAGKYQEIIQHPEWKVEGILVEHTDPLS